MPKFIDPSVSPISFCRLAVRRRTVIGGLAGFAGAAVLPALGQDDIAAAPPAPGDYLVFASGDDQTTPLTPDAIVPNAAPVQAWPVGLRHPDGAQRLAPITC